MAELEVMVIPRASVDRIGPLVDRVLRVRVMRPAVDGQANRALVLLVARALGVPPSSIELVAGTRARRKRLRIDDLDQHVLDERLAALHLD